MARPDAVAYTSADAAAWLEATTEEAASGTSVTWAVTGDDDVLLGVVNLFDIEPGTSAEVGFWAHPEARGRGVITRASALALRHGFETLGLVLIQGHAALGNTASRHALEAIGLREAGIRSPHSTPRPSWPFVTTTARCWPATARSRSARPWSSRARGRSAGSTTTGSWPALPDRPPTRFALFSRFEAKLEQYRGNLERSAVELAKDWRTDRILRRLEAMLIVADKQARRSCCRAPAI